MLLVLGLVPLVGALVVFCLPRGRDLLAKQVTLLFSLATLAVTIGLCVAFDNDSTDRFQFTSSYEWIRSFGVSFSLGADGIALVLIALVAVLVPAVVLASWSEADRAADAEAPATAGARVTTRTAAVAGSTGSTAATAGSTGSTAATAVLDRPGRDDRDPDILAAADEVTEPAGPTEPTEPAGPTVPGTRRGQPKTFFALLLLLEVMMIGVFAATDVFLFYVFFEAMLIPMYFLIGSFGGPAGSTRRSSSSSTRCSAGWSCSPR